jgi:hypothetical protein
MKSAICLITLLTCAFGCYGDDTIDPPSKGTFIAGTAILGVGVAFGSLATYCYFKGNTLKPDNSTGPFTYQELLARQDNRYGSGWMYFFAIASCIPTIVTGTVGISMDIHYFKNKRRYRQSTLILKTTLNSITAVYYF